MFPELVIVGMAATVMGFVELLRRALIASTW